MSNIDEKKNEMHINNILHDHAAIQIKKSKSEKTPPETINLCKLLLFNNTKLMKDNKNNNNKTLSIQYVFILEFRHIHVVYLTIRFPCLQWIQQYFIYYSFTRLSVKEKDV